MLEPLHSPEFPEETLRLDRLPDRREFLRLAGASLALAGLSGCTRPPPEKIVPYVRAPEEAVPGRPLYYATAMPLGADALGLLVESQLGRPIKVEGNPQHPSSLGATDGLAQASVLGLYDPDRSKVVTRRGDIGTWPAFLAEIRLLLEGERPSKGAGLRLLTETVTSPSLEAGIRRLLAEFPAARWHRWDPLARDAARAGAVLAFGEPVEARLHLDRAQVVLALESDLLASGPGCVRHARDFAARRRVRSGADSMARLYAVESARTLTGAMADHRLALRAGEIEGFARRVAGELGILPPRGAPADARRGAFAAALARDLRAHAGACAVVAGEPAAPAVHALAHMMNHVLGNVGAAVVYTEPLEPGPEGHAESLRSLTADLQAGGVNLLVVLGGNPVYTAPADLDFAAALSRARVRVHLGLYEDETSRLCHWHLPEAHYLEAWNDPRAFDGTVTFAQPLIAPLYGGKTVHEVVAALRGEPDRSAHDLVRDHWKGRAGPGDFENLWRRALHDGVVPESLLPTALRPREVAPRAGLAAALEAPEGPAPGAEEIEVLFRLDPTVADGRFANNGWLQELPKPFTKLTWDNAALVSPALARRRGLADEEVVELSYRGRSVRAPVWILPGAPDGTVTLHLGYGRTRGGSLAAGAGFNAYLLRPAEAPWGGPGLKLEKTGERRPLSSTQSHHRMEDRDLVRSGTLERFRREPDFARRTAEAPPSLYPVPAREGYAWGMSIDLGLCSGCGACVMACQAENNIPVVGKAEVARGREMHWIRIDHYHEGGEDDPRSHHQPVLCMHCEHAPCEVVCPTGATVHSSEGLNEMVYNRCVGTRYCSNNCPYKVRRFNFFQYIDLRAESLKLLRNPDVTVRPRGVMEKCTYCVQRINAARIAAKREDREVRDGEVVTACQAACPTAAIVFGDLNDPRSLLSTLKRDPRDYALLAELNTRPRTSYLAKLTNPNPELEVKGP